MALGGIRHRRGLPIAELREIVADMRDAAAKAGVQIVTGDTKVVGKGAADGMYISTAGVGVIPDGPGAVRATGCSPATGPGVGHDRRARHGGDARPRRAAIEADIDSDTAPVNSLVELLLEAAPSTRWMRDATRGGVGTVCNELAKDSGLRA